ncbi:MAG: tryptophan 7-halogenase, partial [Bdellovibrionaceae bacterium]|nr:tryptophan 7-halogenase [Pseudobdellovibrionaceae bacterium]
DQVEITLLESREVGIIGVGEATLPKIHSFFETLGLSEPEWMPAVSATYKNSIKFTGWTESEGYPYYHHPFPSQLDSETRAVFEKHCARRTQGKNIQVHPDGYFLTSFLAERGLSPLTDARKIYWGSYAYHIDTHAMGAYLASLGAERGIQHVEGFVRQVHQADDGSLTGVTTADGRLLTADLFVDCSGFRSLLLQQTLGVGFESYSDYLFNDSAVVAQIPRAEAKIPTYTECIAMKCGWRWEIPLTCRDGAGYVYSSRYITPADAEAEFVAALGSRAEGVQFRHLEMKIGRAHKTWEKNCVAIGLSQGFIEPLESSGLYITQDTIERFIEAYSASGFGSSRRDQFNADLQNILERIRDYVGCHYKFNGRHDHAYWIDGREKAKVSDGVTEKLKRWQAGEKLIP